MSKAPTKTAASPEDRKAAEAAKHAPVSLPSGGSYDREDLQKALDKVVDKDPDNRDAEVNEALERAHADTARTDRALPGQIPGHRMVEAEVQLAAPTEIGSGKDKRSVGGVVVKETRQVLDPSQVKEDEVVAGGQAVTGERSEILSIEDAGEVAEEPAAASGVNE